MKRQLQRLLLLIVASVTLGTLVAPILEAAPNRVPDPDRTTGSYSNDLFVEASQAGAGVNLDAPISWTKLTYPATVTSNYSVSIHDGCFENTWDWYGAYGVTPNGYCYTNDQRFIFTFIFCITDSLGRRRADADSIPEIEWHVNNGTGVCWRIDSRSLSEGTWTTFNVPLSSPRVDRTNTRNIIATGFFQYYRSSATGNGRINAFKIAANGANTVAGFVGGYTAGTLPNAIQNRRTSGYGNFNNDYTFVFAVPCTLSGLNNFWLRWQDADRAGAPEGATPWDPDVSFTLRNATTGQSITSGQLAFLSGQSEATFIGGQNAFRQSQIINAPGWFRVQAGDRFEWTWHSFQRNNGIQFWVPFDTSEYYASCDTTGYHDSAVGNCTAISGWAIDQDSTSTSVRVQIYVDGIWRATIDANLPRPDVNSVLGIPGNHGFSWTIPSTFKDGANHTYEVYALNVPGTAGSNRRLNLSPKTYSCPPVYDADCLGITFISGVFNVGGQYYVEPGTTIRARVRYRNSSTITWTAAQNFRLGSASPYNTTRWAPLSPGIGSARVPLPNNVAPGGTVDFVFNATVPNFNPSGPTLREFDWRMVREGVTWFGDICQANLYVAQRYQAQSPDNATSTISTFLPGTTTTWNINYRVRNTRPGNSISSTGTGVPDVRAITLAEPGYRFLLNGNPVGGINTPSSSNSNMNILGGGSVNRSATATIPSTFSANLGDSLCIQARTSQFYGWEGGPLLNGGNTAWSTLRCITAAEQAYVQIPNGSAWAGGNFDATPNAGYGSTWCTVPGGRTNGFIRSVIRGNQGAWAGFDVGATDTIAGFASGNTGVSVGGAIGGAIERLMFANASGTRGEFYANGNDGKCITDLWKYLSKDDSLSGVTAYDAASPAPTTGTGNHNFPGGANRQQQYYFEGQNLNIRDAVTINAGERITILVDGNVNIGANITYANYNVNDPNNIPILIIIARGDIRIASDVTELHGVYMARPNDGEIFNANPIAGQIDTCAYALNAATNPASPTSGANQGRLSSAVCRNQLRVRGMFVANDIEFRRTYGGVGGTNTNGGQAPAEIIQGHPEVYLANPFFISTFEQNLPIDAFKDLPPVVY